MKIKHICQFCGKEYWIPESQDKRSKFCSNDCRQKSRRKRVIYKCDYCGREFELKTCEIGRHEHYFCSKECRDKYYIPSFDVVKQRFTERGYELLDDRYINAKTKMRYICSRHKECGIQYITYSNLCSGFGCKYCGREKIGDKKRSSWDRVKSLFENQGLVLLDQEYKNSQQYLAYICPHHPDRIQYMQVSNAYHNGCPLCRKSKGEREIEHFFT